MKLLLFGVEALLCVVTRSERSLHLGAIVGERELSVYHLHADLRVELREPKFGLTVFHERPCLRALALRGCGWGWSC